MDYDEGIGEIQALGEVGDDDDGGVSAIISPQAPVHGRSGMRHPQGLLQMQRGGREGGLVDGLQARLACDRRPT